MEYQETVNRFMDVASITVGNAASDNFNMLMFCECAGDTPIEQLFYIAINALLEIDGSRVSYGGGNHGITIRPQEHVDNKYRVDFMILLVDYEKEKVDAKLVVELDGHEFHERNEAQRRYEKARDRYLIGKGFNVIHFTGKEVTDNPFKVAAQTLSLLLQRDVEDFNPINSLPDKTYVF